MTDMFLLPLSPETEAGAIVALNRETEENGLRLTHAQAEQLVEVRAQSLRRTGRIEFAPGRVERIIRAFCDSPYLSQEDYADALSALIELFDTVKTETDDRISDEALIEEMRAAFDENGISIPFPQLDVHFDKVNCQEKCNKLSNSWIHKS